VVKRKKTQKNKTIKNSLEFQWMKRESGCGGEAEQDYFLRDF